MTDKIYNPEKISLVTLQGCDHIEPRLLCVGLHENDEVAAVDMHTIEDYYGEENVVTRVFGGEETQNIELDEFISIVLGLAKANLGIDNAEWFYDIEALAKEEWNYTCNCGGDCIWRFLSERQQAIAERLARPKTAGADN